MTPASWCLISMQFDGTMGGFAVVLFFFLILSNAAIAGFSWLGAVIIRCHYSGDEGGGRGVSLQEANVGITHLPIFAQLAASPVPKTHWRDVSKAWPHHSLAGKDGGLDAWKKYSGSTISWTLPLKIRNLPEELMEPNIRVI